jgi:hypothetical protein
MTMTDIVVRMATRRWSALLMCSVIDKKTLSTKKGVSKKNNLKLKLIKRLLMVV